ncbi:MAG: DUF1499 domain-containing protein [Gammaproteobacteria bacterium]|nr:DUF1499 domain-containing protein [Gammaproteobacteria bacterium]MBU1490136.1 DUF1499 domain-containing protein [Gammaproteobacteria bacterium]MBU2067919.1 DUF1499 domain-containing protein [Gammaproteobacteria bacterium]MBU2140633.1 DUF1499 domain-containing protein [Gammaproteobacteria bacterium]MBU2215287.1 DUF1499 domain-containing protein [Gammaproteobacteria bacterium]
MSQPSCWQNVVIRARSRAHKPATLIAATLLLSACSGSPPEHLGVHNGRLAACPTSPNCVSSQAETPAQQIAPLALHGTPEQTQALLREIVQQTPRARLITDEPGYLRAEYSSRMLRFVDDVELLIGGDAVQVRSASRLGYSDLGVNRERIEALRQALAQAEAYSE